MVSLVKPHILILGSSRAMQIRPALFQYQPVYNASGVVGNLSELILFSEKMAENQVHPKVVFLVVDWWWFAPSNGLHPLQEERLVVPKDKQKVDSEIAFENGKPHVRFLTLSRRMLDDMVRNRQLLAEFLSHRAPCGTEKPVGLSAYVQGSGFRADGSYFYGKRADGCVNSEDYAERHDFRKEISEQKNEIRWQPRNGVCSLCRRQFVYWLDMQRTAGSEVVIFIPPVPPVVRDYLFKDRDMGYLQSTLFWLKEIASQSESLFYDAMWEHPEGESQAYLDPVHPSETTIAKSLLSFARAERKFAQVLHMPVLEKALVASDSRFSLTVEGMTQGVRSQTAATKYAASNGR
ncbi:hypothetical protein EPO44_04625 [bacterium]|nr:MAG: hypothetical protein EPO44_04625 [bacterium]